MNLMQLEGLFWHAVRSKHPPPELSDAFADTGELAVVRRMSIYRSAYWVRQVRTLSEVFPKVAEALGEPAFRRLALDYLEVFPSTAPAIEWVGRHFASFLERETPEISDEIVDLARFEWARLEALLSPDSPGVVVAADVADVDFPRARAQLRSDVRVLRVSKGALALLEKRAEPPPYGRVCCVVFRRNHAVRHLELADPEATALERLARGEPFASVCSAFPNPDAAARAARAIATWLGRGWIARLHDGKGQDLSRRSAT